jgi:hypothetical protein
MLGNRASLRQRNARSDVIIFKPTAVVTSKL